MVQIHCQCGLIKYEACRDLRGIARITWENFTSHARTRYGVLNYRSQSVDALG